MKFQVNLDTLKKNVEVIDDFKTEEGFKKTGKSIPQLFCTLLDQNPELVDIELTQKMVESMVVVLNFGNYFSNKIDDDIYYSLDAEKLIKWANDNRSELKTTNDNMSTKARLKAWQDRSKPYFKSHIVGNSDSNCLNKDPRFKYKASFDENTQIVVFSLKNKPKNKKDATSK